MIRDSNNNVSLGINYGLQFDNGHRLNVDPYVFIDNMSGSTIFDSNHRLQLNYGDTGFIKDYEDSTSLSIDEKSFNRNNNKIELDIDDSTIKHDLKYQDKLIVNLYPFIDNTSNTTVI